MSICECCSVNHDGLYGSGRFCSSVCARSFSTKKNRNSINEKVSKKLKKPFIVRVCKNCGNSFNALARTKICSDVCRSKIKSDSAKLAYQTKIKNGNFVGWKARTKEPSYPEQYFIDLFKNEKIEGYVRELNVGKWFIDFAFSDKMLAVEIDGKQHERQDRKEKDFEKDRFLVENGWRVIRIKWKNPINVKNKIFLYLQIEKL
jgi:very-short-patch-repair endonuclease